MAHLIERDGKTYCVEVDGTEWEYSPPIPSNDPPPIDELAQIKQELAEARDETLMTMSALADVFELVLALQEAGGSA